MLNEQLLSTEPAKSITPIDDDEPTDRRGMIIAFLSLALSIPALIGA